MGFKSWLRKILIDEATEKPQQSVPQHPPIVFEVDKVRHEIVFSILQGKPFFAIIKSPSGLTTWTTGFTPEEIRKALDDAAVQIPEMKDILTNVAIDINTATNAKKNENR